MRDKLLLLCVVAAACAPAAKLSRGVAAGATGVAEADALGMVDGIAIHTSDIPAATLAKLQDLENEHAQRRYQLLWTGVEEAIAAHLLAAEAQQRGADVATLVRLEVDSKIGKPSDAEIRDLYEANRGVIGVSFENAAPVLQEQWHDDRVTQLRRALVDKLRQDRVVRYNLPPPTLPRYSVEAGEGFAVGPKDAAVTIVEFGDYQCPYSAQARRLLRKVGQLYPQTVRLVFRDFPLAQHPQALKAAQAAQCAGEQDKFWAYYDLLFENNDALAPADLKRYAVQAELDAEAFTRCLASERPVQAVAANVSAGQRFGVQGTPAIFVNGMRLQGVLPLPLMQAIIDRELANL